MRSHDKRILVQDGFITVAGLRLEYRRIPQCTAGGPMLVLLHEGLGVSGCGGISPSAWPR